MPDTTSSINAALLACAVALLLAAMLYPTQLLRWLQRKRYQYEVTFSLYMLTPTEKFIFNSFLFLFLSMIIIAGSLYLPEHLSLIANRVFYYWAGEESGAGTAAEGVRNVAAGVAASAVPTAVGGGAEGLRGLGEAQGAALRGQGRGYMEQ